MVFTASVKYTIWVFHKDLKILRFSLRRPLFIFLIMLLTFSLFALGTFPFLAYKYLRKDKELKSLRAELQYRTEVYGKKIEEITRKLEALREFERRLRIMANLRLPQEKKKGTVAVGGTGGEGGIGLELLDEKAIEDLMKEVNGRLEGLQEVQEALEAKIERLRRTPSLWPTEGMVTCGFGPRVNPFTGREEFHTGIDISNRLGTPIIAPADGRVEKVWSDPFLGLAIKIDHGYGIETIYGHLDAVLVKPGQKVKRGEKIALMGNTGRSTGPHLHYEVHVRGRPRNPQEYLLD